MINTNNKNNKFLSGNFDFESYQKEVVLGLMSGKGLMGKEGLLKPLIAKFVEAALDAELTAHLKEESLGNEKMANKRNGRMKKQLRTEAGELTINYRF